ncbi:S1 family peptidase [Dyella monticola]|nr:serine protease [Dyella monticola]
MEKPRRIAQNVIPFPDLCSALLLLVALLTTAVARADTLDPSTLAKVRAATFEVVMAKPVHDPLTYAKPLPLDLLPYQERNDKFYSVGTAFAIGHNRYVTAGHVIALALHSLWGPPALRDGSGHVYAIDSIESYASDRDFVVFSLANNPSTAPLEANTHPVLNQPIYAVGDALGEGIVVRDGLYTSDTPEDQDGRWKWIRFSAAASPGNSGGPLLDKSGKVIGVVLAKSPNENLNYALPIAELLNAPKNQGVFNVRNAYGLPIMDTQVTGTYSTSFSLPLSLADFITKLEQVHDAHFQAQRDALLKQEAPNLFPNGAGAERILHAVAPLNIVPELIVRTQDGSWHGSVQKGSAFPLPDGAQVSTGHAGAVIFFHVRRPDHLAATSYYDKPKLLMDTMLATGFSTRAIGTEKINITSMGEPAQTIRHLDAWGRPWRIDIWPIPFGNTYAITTSLAVPDGYVVIFNYAAAPDKQTRIGDLETITDFVSVAYSGTLRQWQEYLSNQALLPASLKDAKLDVNYGSTFAYASNHIKLAFTSKVQKIAPDSTLRLGFAFFKNQSHPTLDVADVRVKPQDGGPDRINVRRVIQPAEDMSEQSKQEWQKYALAKHPYDGVAYVDNDVASIAKVLKPTHERSDVLYSAFLGVEGNQSADVMKTKLDQIVSGLQINDTDY